MAVADPQVFPCAVLVLAALWHLFLLNFMMLEFNPLFNLSRTLSSKMLPYSFQLPAIRRYNLAFLYHCPSSWFKILQGLSCGTSPLFSLISVCTLESFNITNSLHCSITQAIYSCLLHDNILGYLSKCLLKLKMSNVKCLFLIYLDSRPKTGKKKRVMYNETSF